MKNVKILVQNDERNIKYIGTDRYWSISSECFNENDRFPFGKD